MFKSIEYVGFEGQPELLAKAEELTPVLAQEIRTWRSDVAVRWSPHRDHAAGVLDLTLSLTLPNGVSETHLGTFVAEDFSRHAWLASRCRRVWDDLLGLLLEKQNERVQSYLLETAEA